MIGLLDDTIMDHKDSLLRAMTIAHTAHAGQKYGEKSYFEGHLAQVAAQVKADGGDEKAVEVAWLHDLLEDTLATEAFLKAQGVDPEVIAAVVVLTHREGVPYMHYVAEVATNPLAKKVKVADIKCNMKAGAKPGDPEHMTATRMLKYRNALVFLIGKVE